MNMLMNENFMKNFFDNQVMKNFTSGQYIFGDQAQKAVKMGEEFTQKTIKAFTEQVDAIMSNKEKVEEMTKVTQENQKKMQEVFEVMLKNNFEQKFVEEQMKQFENNFTNAYKSMIEQVEKNNQFITDNIVGKSFENSMGFVQNMNENFLKYSQEQFNFFVAIQKEVMNGMKDKTSIQEMPNKIVKISQEIMEHNTKTVNENVKNAVEVGNKVVTEGMKTVIEVGNKASQAVSQTKSKK
mgnify:CR=1 FL=1